jgi:lytic murein transglycosylase
MPRRLPPGLIPAKLKDDSKRVCEVSRMLLVNLRKSISRGLSCLSLAGAMTLLSLVASFAQAPIDAQFTAWLKNDLWPEARSRGISQSTFNTAFSGVSPNLKLPDLVLPGQKQQVPQKQHQAEFRSPARYFAENIIAGVVNGGRPLYRKHNTLLAALERQTGVPGHIVIAIWGRESAFGRAKIPYNAFEVLGTKAFLATRKDYFRTEVLAALEMVEKRGVPPRLMRGSWAGALGQPQFMPSSYMKHARNRDGDPFADIWNSEPDTLYSIAGYLADKGWVRGRDWGFEVNLPASVPCYLEGPDQGRKISEWEKMGIARVGGKAFPVHERGQIGFLMLPAGRYGPAFIVTPNFFVLKEYNESDVYALFVGHAGDRIAYGVSPFRTGWQSVDKLSRSDVAAMQHGLERLGRDVGGADGLAGFKTRRSVGAWQAANGRNTTCYPDREIIRALK